MPVAENLVRNCAGITADEKALVVADLHSRNAAKMVAKEAGAKVLILENYGSRPLKSVPAKLGKRLENADVVFFTARSLLDEQLMRNELKHEVLKQGRFIYAPDLTARLLGMQFDYRKIDVMARRLYSTLKNSGKIRISGHGMKLDAKLSDSWRLDSGICHRKGEWTEIPSGVLSVNLSTLNGRILVNMLGSHFSRKYGIVDNLVMQITNGRVSDIRVSDVLGSERMINALREHFRSDKNAAKASALSFGANTLLKQPSGDFRLDRTMPSVSISFGNPSSNLDAVAFNATVEILEPFRLEIMKSGEYIF